MRRAARLSLADATPEPVAKGKKVTVAGKLIRANSTTHRNGPYAGSKVALQFRAKSASTFRTLKTVTTSSAGALRTQTAFEICHVLGPEQPLRCA
ncbi:hypothetical protein AB0945_39665 [Streptomyces sp. NPDC005474]|uniref:hypothetical protein n=1 Tax=Streptomyces sp. NPDC005474 TaxID=3154878 RepID=UPI0034564224